MNAYSSLLDHIAELAIIDTHEHLPLEDERPASHDVLTVWLYHYFSSDLVSAGLSPSDLAFARDPGQPLQARWARIEPCWRAAESTGYGRALSIAARDLYGVERIDAVTIGTLAERFRAAFASAGNYAQVLGTRSRIALSIRDGLPNPYRETGDPFVYSLHTDDLACPANYSHVRRLGEQVGLEVHTLEDYMDVVRRLIEKWVDGRTRVVCLKCALAYRRSLRFEKVVRSDAERAFNEFFADGNLPDWRTPPKAATALSDWLVHHICRVADDHQLAIQFHTGIQEGNGNFVADANPLHLTNLLLEYRNARFDLFHMGYPYVMELGNLAKNFRNAFIDMCWGHIISPEAARRALVEWLDAVPANKISAFGGDYRFEDGVYGHQYLARRNVARALATKVDDGSFDLARAREIATWLFVDNPRRLFGLDRFLDAKR